MRKFISMFLIMAFMSAPLCAFADGFLDMEPSTRGERLQTLSPAYGNTVFAQLSAGVTAGTKVLVSNFKKIYFAATTVAGAALPVKVYLYNTSGTQGTVFVEPSGVREIGIGSDVKYVGFAQYSSGTHTNNISVWAR